MIKFFSLSNITLIVALSLSTVAAYYSIIGLTAIFAGAVIPIIVMGSILEIGKITTTVWLRKYWDQCSLYLKLYLVPAVVLLAVLTSMGIFGFLSKAHMDSGLVSGDVQAKLSLYDEKIKTERDNIETARKALQQMDAQVEARLSRGDSEQSAERAVQIRRQQQGERQKLLKEISDAQAKIAKLNEERAPIAAENRKVEAEVGPIKYVAALIYGDNPDNNLLERAVRWVIILLVIVFDPLAIALVLAANASKEWDREKVKYKKDDGPLSDEQIKQIEDDVAAMAIKSHIDNVTTRKFSEEEIEKLDDVELKTSVWPFPDPIIKEVIVPKPMIFVDPGEHPNDSIETVEVAQEESVHTPETHPYLNQGFKKPDGWESVSPLVYKPEIDTESITEEQVKDIAKKLNIIATLKNDDVVEEPIVKEPVIEEKIKEDIVISDAELAEATELNPNQIKELDGGYILYDGKSISKDALKEIKPELFKITADSHMPVSTKFGTQFPKLANKGDMFIRVDVLPNRLFKFDGRRWFEVNKDTLDSYLEDDYIKFLVSKLETGEYDLENLSDKEKDQIETYLKSQKL